MEGIKRATEVIMYRGPESSQVFPKRFISKTVATILNVLNKAGSNIACAILNAAFTVVPKTGSNISVGVT